jgi:hypothetical protein
MSKKNKRSKSAEINAKYSQAEINPLVKKTILVDLISIALSIIFLFILRVNPSVGDAVVESSNILFIPFLFTWFALGIINYKNYESLQELKDQIKIDSKIYRHLLKRRIIISAVAIFLCTLGFFYLSGGHYWVKTMLERLMSRTPKWLINSLAHFLECGLSGIIGNSAYRYFKKILRNIHFD